MKDEKFIGVFVLIFLYVFELEFGIFSIIVLDD